MSADAHNLGASATTPIANDKSVQASVSINSDSPSDTNMEETAGTSNVDADDSLTFTPEQCLFCNLPSPDLDSNISHMHKKHGLFIPADIEDGSLQLAVDLETLLRYLHLVVFEYNECLYCHSQKQTTQAAQQHMMGKCHCRIDLGGEDSEFKDFYEVEDETASSEDGLNEDEAVSNSDDDEETGEASGHQPRRRQTPSNIDGKSLSLASGKVISHRSAPPPRHHRPLSETQSLARRGADHKLPTSSSPAAGTIHASTGSDGDDDTPGATTTSMSSGKVLTRLERRAESSNKSTLSLAMARLSANDRSALAHLPAAEKRAVVLSQFKQQDKARHSERRYRGKMDRKNNSLLMKHFISDVPGPKLG